MKFHRSATRRLMRPTYVSLFVLTACSAGSDGHSSNPSIMDPLVHPDPNVSAPAGHDQPTRPGIDGLVDDLGNGAVQAGWALNVAPGSDLSSWRNAVADTTYAPDALASKLDAAIGTVGTNPGIDFGKWEIDFHNQAVPSTNQTVVAYPPERARWTADAPAPPGVEEIRERGARLYCAAREAYLANGGAGASRSMGSKSLAHFNVLGKRIDLFKAEPSVALRAPRKFVDGQNDGAQAFTIPMAVGARFSPISPMALPEMRTSVDFVTADGEVTNPIDDEQIYLTTATHADAFSMVAATASTDFGEHSFPITDEKKPLDLTLFTVGPIAVSLDLSMAGQTAGCSQAEDIAGCTDNPQQQVKRLLATSVSGYPTARSGGPTSSGADSLYDDSAWVVDDSNNISMADTGRRLSWNYPSPFWSRMYQDNDKSFEIRTGMSLEGQLSAVLGVDISQLGLMIDAKASGDLTATTAVVHAIREQLEEYGNDNAEFGPFAQTSLTVTPHMELDLTLAFEVSITFELKLPLIGSVDFKITPLKQTLANASHSFPAWDEDHRLRIATAVSDYQGNMNANPPYSHWPGGSSFPGQSMSLDDCLNESNAPGDAPGSQNLDPPCDAVQPADDPANAAPPHGEFCFVEPQAILDESKCDIALQNFVNGNIVTTTNFNGDYDNVRLLPLDPSDSNAAPTWQAMQDALAACDNGDPSTIQSILDSHIYVCDANGQPLQPDQAFQVASDDSDGQDVPAAACH